MILVGWEISMRVLQGRSWGRPQRGGCACVSMGMGKREGSHEGPTGQEREWWGLHTGDTARETVYRARVGRSPLGLTEQERVPLQDREVSMESHRARRGPTMGQRGAQRVPQLKFPSGAERCP